MVEKLQEWNFISICIRMFLSFLCGMALGLRPEYKNRPAGMRTHILVCLGATTASMTGFFVYYTFGIKIDPLRIAAQVISGIGFLGVGTIIIMGRSQVKGLTTAAGLWTCAAVGISLGAGFYLGGLLCTAFALLTIFVMETVEKRKIQNYWRIDIYLEITDIHKVNEVVETLHQPKYYISNLQIKPARSGLENNLGVEATLLVGRGKDKEQLLDQIAELKDIAFAIESE